MSMTTFSKQNADNGFSEEGTHNTPDYSPFKHVRTIFRLIGNVTTAIKYKRNVYIRIGNFHFLSENDNTLFSLDRLEEIERRMEVN